MKPLLLAFSLIRVPRLFCTLLLWPLVIGVFVAITQVVFSSLFLHVMEESPDDYAARVEGTDVGVTWLQEELYQSDQPLGPPLICRWIVGSNGDEYPPTRECAIDPLDVTVEVENPETFDAAPHAEFFNGATRRIHLCRSCGKDVRIRTINGEIQAHVFSLKALGVLALADVNADKGVNPHYIEARRQVEKYHDLTGTIFLHPPGFDRPVNISKTSKTMVMVVNTAFIVLITLWLSLVGHRKVLQYFARNDALLPLVAACGKETFYSALWIITLIRVGFFLLASVPTAYISYRVAVPDELLNVFLGEQNGEFLLWVTGIVSSLSAFTIIASIAELKHRHSLLSFAYKYLPMLLCLAGTALWTVSVFSSGSGWWWVQHVIASLPLVGLSPMILAPIFRMSPTIIALHAMFASVLVVVCLRFNSRWFAAHLEEI